MEQSTIASHGSASSVTSTVDLHSRDRLQHPYEPSSWLERARVQATLGRPELVVSDTWKAIKLSQLILSCQAFQQGWRLGHGCGFWMKDIDLVCDVSILQNEKAALHERMRSVGEEALQLQLQSQVRFQKSDGEMPRTWRFVPRQYPWLEERHQYRDDTVLDQINKEFADAIRPPEGRHCIARRRALKGNADDAFGVFATTDIKSGQLVLVDQSDIWGCTVSPSLIKDASRGTACSGLDLPRREALQILGLVGRSESGDQARTMLKIRCLRKTVQDGVRHPLDHPLLARLKPTYHRNHAMDFHLMDDVEIPNEALIMLGVDIFSNEAFDSWILNTIEARIDNNCCIIPTSAYLGTLFPLFNHSCSPNLRWTSSSSPRSVALYAERDIQEGEQLYVAYNTFSIDLPVAQRQSELQRWIEGRCKCERCEQEIRAATKGNGPHRTSQWEW